jgi:hypothetical protein
MVRDAGDRDNTSTSPLRRFSRGQVLGQLTREVAERGYQLYRERKVVRVTWTGTQVEAVLTGPPTTVSLGDRDDQTTLVSRCTSCTGRQDPCVHAAAALLQWLDVRPTMLRLGAGTIWRSGSRHPFLAAGRAAADRVDLSHLTGVDLRSALELQLSLHRAAAAVATLVNGEVQIGVILPSGDPRVVFFAADLLPGALPTLNALPRLRLEGELANLELSEARLQAVLRPYWQDDAIVLEPAYCLADGSTFTLEELRGRIHGRWARLGGRLCLLLDPATPLVPYHRKGRQVLHGREALRFLTLDMPQLVQCPHYRPEGALAAFQQPLVPRPRALEASREASGRIRLRPTFAAGKHEVSWRAALRLFESEFARLDDAIVRAPEVRPFERAGFRLPRRGRERGLVGDRIALIRVLAETRLPLTTSDPDLAQLVTLLSGHPPPDITPPAGLRSSLRAYQLEGVAWLESRYLTRVGALLADDMGLGKTHQVMGLLCRVQERLPQAEFLVVCPRGVLEHWRNLLETFAPGLPVQTFHGPGRILAPPPPTGGVVLTTYDTLIRSASLLVERRWEIAVFDEAQRIKNTRTKAARAARRIPAEFRTALTGTPLENRLTELWSVVDLILPGYLGSEREFRAVYRNPSQQQLQRLRHRLGVLTLRRLKDQVLADLPEKVEDVRYCRLTPQQEALYQSIHTEYSPEISTRLGDPGADIPYIHIFALLTRLKQVCDHPALVGAEAGRPAAGKLEVLDEILDQALAADHRVVVFSQYATMVEVLLRHLRSRRLKALSLTGATRDRERVIRRFNSGQHERVLVATLMVGGVGIDLTGASAVIHYDRWWNPARENQATDRVHRIGQRRFVQVFKLVTRDTIEERIDAIIKAKLKLIDEVVVPTDQVVRSLDRRELAQLLGLKVE